MLGRGVAIVFLIGFLCLFGIYSSSTVLEELRKASLPNSNESPAKTPPNSTQEQQSPPAPKFKFYAIHIGPSKTGTSTIQSDMVQNPFQENTFARDKDNVIYVGLRKPAKEVPDPFKGEEIRRVNGRSITPRNERIAYQEAITCMEDILEDYYQRNGNDSSLLDDRLETDQETRAMLKQRFINECWKTEGKDYSYMLDYSIFDSWERYSSKYKLSVNREFRLFDILGYEKLLVIGAYRRYADWLVSVYNEMIKKENLYPNDDGLKLQIPCRHWKEYLQSRLEFNGTEEFNGIKYRNLHETLPEIVEAAPSKLETKILNYFQLPHSLNNEKSDSDASKKAFNSITTELYCDALGMELMPHTCNHAQRIAEDSKTAKTSSLKNKGSPSYGVYQQIVATGYQMGYLLFTDEYIQREKEACNNVWYELLKQCLEKNDNNDKLETKRRLELDQVTSHGLFPIVGTNSSKIAMYKDLSDYHTKVHQRTWTESLPILCPQKDLLHDLLNRSLAFERLILPEFYADPDLGEKEHTRLFWDVWFTEKKLFCWVDLPRLFQNATSWDQIINERMVKYDWGEPREAS